MKLRILIRTSRLFRAASFVPLVLCLLSLGCSSGTLSRADQFEASNATLGWLQNEYGLVNHYALNQLLTRIADRLSNAGDAASHLNQAELHELKSNEWKVFVIEHGFPNAFSLGMGTVVLTRGMLAETNTEAELAAIIAHEMAHQILGHTTAALSRSRQSHRQGKTPHAPGATFFLPDELAADSLSVKLLYLGRYDHQAALATIAIGGRALPISSRHGTPDWLNLRMANLHQVIATYPPGLPATVSTREFNRVRSSVFR